MSSPSSATPTSPRAIAKTLVPDGVSWIHYRGERLPYLWRLGRLGGTRADELEQTVATFLDAGVPVDTLPERLVAYATWAAETVPSERARASGLAARRYLAANSETAPRSRRRA